MALLELTATKDSSDTHKLKLANKIGRGAFGEVYKGTFDGNVCAIKTTLACGGGEDVQYQLYAREARALSDCSHSRIIGFKALVRLNNSRAGKPGCQKGGRWALVLEYAKGGALSERVMKQMIHPGLRVYTMTQALQWALDIASGLDYLHSRSPMVLHRDIKLSNVLLVKEDNKMVAKVSDLGLHVTVDSSMNQLFRVGLNQVPNIQKSLDSVLSSSEDAAGARSTDVFATGGKGNRMAVTLTKEHLQVLQQQLQKTSNPHTVCSNANSVRPQQESQDTMLVSAAVPISRNRSGYTADHHYTEIHDSAGVTTFVGSPARDSALADTGVRFRSAAASGLNMHCSSMSSCAAGVSASVSCQAPAMAALSAEQLHQPDAEANSVAVAEVQPDGRQLRSAVDGDSVGDAGPLVWLMETGSMCSMATDATWLSDGSAMVDSSVAADKSLHESSDDSSCVTDVETVFDMTGQTGSCMYMAPEVFLGQPYNEKADVFSFGVVLYELMTQCMLVFTELPTSTTDPTVTEKYAKKVSEGYRPSKPKRMSSDVWELITACWQQEPMDRPNMKQVMTALQKLLEKESGGSVVPKAAGTPVQQNRIGSSVVAVGAAVPDVRCDQQRELSDVGNSGAAESPPGSAAKCACVIC